MIRWRDLVADIFRLRSYQPLHCKQLVRSNHIVGAASKKIHAKTRKIENANIDANYTLDF